MRTELQNIRDIKLNIGIPANIKLAESDNPPFIDIDIPERFATSYKLKTSQDCGILDVGLRSHFSDHCLDCKCNLTISLPSAKLQEVRIDAVMGNIDIGSLSCRSLEVRDVQGTVKLSPDLSADRVKLNLIQTDSDINLNPANSRVKIKSVNGTTLLNGKVDIQKIKLKSINSRISIGGSNFCGNLDICNCGSGDGLDCEIINGKFIFENL